MGCDIHLHIEVKIGGEWHHYGAPSIRRDYALFEKMAGVRGEVSEAIAPPKGLPTDCTFLTKFLSDYEGGDGHSHSYLTAPEIVLLADWLNSIATDSARGHDLEMDILHTFLFGNSFDGFVRYPEDNPKGLEDVRFVFWFDN
jgi:hypothetical protein